MAEAPNTDTSGDEFAGLEQAVARLLGRCASMEREIGALREQQEQLIAERARLIEHRETARTRIEAMVNRLKSLEQG